MGNSLQEQLLKAGLVDKSRLQQAKKQSRKQKRVPNAPDRDSVAQAVARAQAEKEARDRDLNRQKEVKEAAKARRALLRQFVEQNKLNSPAAEHPYNFVHGSSVKRIYVSDAQRGKLGEGRLAVVQVAERYYLVSSETAQKVKKMAPDIFLFVPVADVPAQDDPYGDYQVPDDLMW